MIAELTREKLATPDTTTELLPADEALLCEAQALLHYGGPIAAQRETMEAEQTLRQAFDQLDIRPFQVASVQRYKARAASEATPYIWRRVEWAMVGAVMLATCLIAVTILALALRFIYWMWQDELILGALASWTAI